MTRRKFLSTLLGGLGLVAAGCSSPRAAAQEPPTPYPTASLPFPNQTPARPTVTATPPALLPEEQGSAQTPAAMASPRPTSRPLAYLSRPLPPERLIVPSIDLDARVIPLGTRSDQAGAPIWETAAFAVGFYRDSARPGEPGNVVMSGHISSPREGAIFQRLPDLKVGDGIVVGTAQQRYLYTVRDRLIVKPTAIEFLETTRLRLLTLVTCYPDQIYSHRLIVRAELV